MDDKELSVYITDTKNDIDLKVYEEKDKNEKTIFTFVIEPLKKGTKIVLKLEEDIAAIIFEGLNLIFEEDDSEFQIDDNSSVKMPFTSGTISFSGENSEDFAKSLKKVEDFFKNLNKTDKNHFGFEENDDDKFKF